MADDYSDLISTSYASGSVHFTGLGSGTDFDTIVTQLVDIESQSLTRMANEHEEWENKVEAVQQLNTSALALATTIESMDTPSEFLTKDAVTSDETTLSATAGTDAEDGTHNIAIQQLAQNEIAMSKEGFASSTANITDATEETFSYTYDGTDISLTIAANTSLQALTNMINSDPDNPGIRASIINDGSENGYHLQVRGMDQGADFGLTISAAPTSFTSAFETTQSAQNAQIKVDGWPVEADSYIERDSNTIDDVITGLTLNLKQTTGAGETISVTTSTDTSAIKEKVVSFVDQVNEVLLQIQSLTKVDTDDNTASLLTGNFTIDTLESSIKSILSSRGIGFDPDEDPISSLVGQHIYGSDSLSVGITTDTAQGSTTFGLLILDEATLDNALEEDPESVSEIFSANLIPATDSSDFSYNSLIDGTTQGGSYAFSYTVAADGSIESATIDGTTYDYAGGAGGKSGDILTSLTGPSKGLAIQINNMATGEHSGTIRLKEGKTSQLLSLLDEATDAYSGTIKLLKDNFNDTIDNLEDQMTDEQNRISDYAQSLRERFARLEVTLGQYSGIQDLLTSQISQLTSSND